MSEQSEELQAKELVPVLRDLLSQIRSARGSQRDPTIAFGVLFDKYAHLRGWQSSETEVR